MLEATRTDESLAHTQMSEIPGPRSLNAESLTKGLGHERMNNSGSY